ncbi:MAG TPA: methyltransferase domain-containing protein [Candidatus Binataceae bacterium]|jgi:ubiquinone/menaquinone biosynthesis C-methylase UbiE|nr:methyltransferase domain-containing protein [Candidatus Binataceae bacterium]
MKLRRWTLSRAAAAHLCVAAAALAIAAAAAGCSSGDEDVGRLAELLAVRPGSVVADVGAGRGAMTLVMAGLVGPRGRVYSTEIDPAALAQIRSAARAAGLANVVVVKATASDTGLPARCCDAIFLSRVYHHLTDPADYNASLLRALRPGGRLAVLDFRPTILLWLWRPKGLPANREGHGVDPIIVSSEMTHAGFEYIRMIDPWPGSWFISSYCLLFERPPQGPATASPAAPPAPASASGNAGAGAGTSAQ